MTETKSVKRVIVGQVTSASMEKTRKVEVKWSRRHPRYGKVVQMRTRYSIHDQNNESSVGDWVEFAQCRPISKSKHWALVRVLDRSETAVSGD